jgi:lon-related putative ATP-dependent protease
MKPLSPDDLVRHCDPASLPFETTAELPDLEASFDQARAVDAVRFALGMRQDGYNLYVMGPPGYGKQTLVRRYIEAESLGRPPPPDWCYVMNFADPRRPRALRLPPGRGEALRRDMAALVDELASALPSIFESEAYRAHREATLGASTERGQAATGAVDAHGETASGGQPIGQTHAAFDRLLDELPERGRTRRDRLRELDRELARCVVGRFMEALKGRYRDLAEVTRYLEQLEADVAQHMDLFRHTDTPSRVPAIIADPDPALGRYRVNVVVDHRQCPGPPVVFPDPCDLLELVGRIEHVAHLGTLVTDFTLIRPGALHRANGGYLLLDAAKVLANPLAWEGLKRCMRRREVRVDAHQETSGPVSMASIEPEPLPLDVKVVLFGDRLLYYLLHEHDPEFRELFKVQADFADSLPRGPQGAQSYARFVASTCRRDAMLPFDRAAVARLIDHGARLAEDSEKLSAHLENLADLVREAHSVARDASKSRVGRGDVERAIDARVARADRLREEVYDAILRDILVIDSAGDRVGQVNGLSVLRLGDFEFAEPIRITATVRIGEGDVFDIQREADMGGALHSKGVMTLSSFLGARFAKTAPLSLAASLAFEQTYEAVEGDSASLAELCALLSALADLPIRQSLAVTGAVDQYGRVQAIGSVNEKIEGFFDICRRRGLNGAHGVLIPASNRTHLMLRDDVVGAVREGRFAVYAVGTVDEAIELLTGIPAGAPDARGLMAAGGINARVQARLHEFSLIRREYSRRGRRRFAPDRD